MTLQLTGFQPWEYQKLPFAKKTAKTHSESIPLEERACRLVTTSTSKAHAQMAWLQSPPCQLGGEGPLYVWKWMTFHVLFPLPRH